MNAIPTDYQPGYEKARKIDASLAELYVRHTRLGDPVADAMTEALMAFPPKQGQEWIRRAMDHGAESIADAPEAVRVFFAEAETVPDWFDPAKVSPGCRGFHRQSNMFLGAFVGAVLVEGFATLISKSFGITGRLVDQGVSRLKQNNRHIMEIFLPGGLDRQGDGWKLSVRIRLVHARVRHLMKSSPDWQESAWGTPLSSAHIAFATAVFSALLLKRSQRLGVKLSGAERDSFLMIWRYSGHLMGVSPELLFKTEAEALQLHRIGVLCEPPPSEEAMILANGLINSAPIVAGITDPAERRRLAQKIYQISRALIGDTLADQLRFPASSTFGVLTFFVWKNRKQRWLHHFFPSKALSRQAFNFQRLIDKSLYPDEGIRYRMPSHVHAEKDEPL